MNQDDWRTDEQKEVDLGLENQGLEADLGLQAGVTYKNGDVDPKLHNAFLKNVMAFEEADKEPHVPVRTLFPEDFKFPPASSMSRKQLSDKIKEIVRVLTMHDIQFGFANKLPDKVLYKYLVEDFIPNESVGTYGNAGFTFVIDGCDGACEDCFQKNYCSTAKEILE
ncbi:MAG TPA: hypothetical protein VLX68_03420 [Chitinivibrionales bacterium]|nr:hypothetical protein [Chitinivibrionales bacterium]